MIEADIGACSPLTEASTSIDQLLPMASFWLQQIPSAWLRRRIIVHSPPDVRKVDNCMHFCLS
jgi:hypothetical protein